MLTRLISPFTPLPDQMTLVHSHWALLSLLSYMCYIICRHAPNVSAYTP